MNCTGNRSCRSYRSQIVQIIQIVCPRCEHFFDTAVANYNRLPACCVCPPVGRYCSRLVCSSPCRLVCIQTSRYQVCRQYRQVYIKSVGIVYQYYSSFMEVDEYGLRFGLRLQYFPFFAGQRREDATLYSCRSAVFILVCSYHTARLSAGDEVRQGAPLRLASHSKAHRLPVTIASLFWVLHVVYVSNNRGGRGGRGPQQCRLGCAYCFNPRLFLRSNSHAVAECSTVFHEPAAAHDAKSRVENRVEVFRA